MFKQRWRKLTLKNPEDNSGSGDRTVFGKIFYQLITRKPLRDIIIQTNERELTRIFNFFTLNTLGLGAIIGAGIFTLVGNAAAHFAGAAEILALLIGTLPAFLAALSFAEMSSMIPASGSSYTYIYTVMGEFSAWLVGWDLCLEYMCAAAAVAVSWANYFKLFIELVSSTNIEHRLLSAPISWNVTAQSFYLTGSWVCLPAVLIILFLTALIVYDIGASSVVNSIIVTAKILILIIFICACIKHIDTQNYRPILPESQGGSTYGITGLFHATAISFFAFIGFDAITTAAQEAKKEAAKRLPLSILTSLGIAVTLYLGIASVMLGVVNYKDLKATNPIGEVCKIIGMTWLGILVCLAAIFGLTSVIIVSLYGQSRIFYAMSKDGLLTPAFSKTHLLKRKPVVNNTVIFSTMATTTTTSGYTVNSVETTVRINAAIEETSKSTGSPVWASIVTGFFCAAAAGFLPIDFLAETTSIGTLFAFIMVHISIIIMHWTHKPQENIDPASDISDSTENLAMHYINTRSITFPSRTLICPIMGILTCLLLMWFTTMWTKVRFVGWSIGIGQPVYWLYSRKHSILGNKLRRNSETIDPTNACGNNLALEQLRQLDVTTITNISQTTIIDNRSSSSVQLAEMTETQESITITRL